MHGQSSCIVDPNRAEFEMRLYTFDHHTAIGGHGPMNTAAHNFGPLPHLVQESLMDLKGG